MWENFESNLPVCLGSGSSGPSVMVDPLKKMIWLDFRALVVGWEINPPVTIIPPSNGMDALPDLAWFNLVSCFQPFPFSKM